MFGSASWRSSVQAPVGGAAATREMSGAPASVRRRSVAAVIVPGWICCVVRREQSICQRAQWDTVIEEAVATTHHSSSMSQYGDHAKPTRGETLFLSVLIVCSNSRSYRTPAFNVNDGADLPLVLRIKAQFGIVLLDRRGCRSSV